MHTHRAFAATFFPFTEIHVHNFLEEHTYADFRTVARPPNLDAKRVQELKTGQYAANPKCCHNIPPLTNFPIEAKLRAALNNSDAEQMS